MTVAVAIGLLAAASYALRAAGLFIPEDNPQIQRLADPLTAAILASLVVTSSITAGTSVVVDARVVGLAVAAIAALLRFPLAVTITLAVAATALTRIVN